MLLLSSLRVSREVEKQACLPTDGQKEIFIWSLRAEVQERMCVLAGLLPPTSGPSHAGGDIISLSVVTLFFATVVCELGIKGPSMAVRCEMVENGGFECPVETSPTRKGNHCSDRVDC